MRVKLADNPKRVTIISTDADGCGYFSTRTTNIDMGETDLDWFRKSAAAFNLFHKIHKIIMQTNPNTVVYELGSNRQSANIDKLNSVIIKGRPPTPSAMLIPPALCHDLSKIHPKIEHVVDTMLMADIFYGRPSGHNYAMAARVLSTHDWNDQAYNDSDPTVHEHEKISLILTKVLRAAAMKPQALIHYNFLDDIEDEILDCVYDFFVKYGHRFIPTNVTLQLHHHNPQFTIRGIKEKTYMPIQGSAEHILPNYEWIPRFLAFSSIEFAYKTRHYVSPSETLSRYQEANYPHKMRLDLSTPGKNRGTPLLIEQLEQFILELIDKQDQIGCGSLDDQYTTPEALVAQGILPRHLVSDSIKLVLLGDCSFPSSNSPALDNQELLDYIARENIAQVELALGTTQQSAFVNNQSGQVNGQKAVALAMIQDALSKKMPATDVKVNPLTTADILSQKPTVGRNFKDMLNIEHGLSKVRYSKTTTDESGFLVVLMHANDAAIRHPDKIITLEFIGSSKAQLDTLSTSFSKANFLLPCNVVLKLKLHPAAQTKEDYLPINGAGGAKNNFDWLIRYIACTWHNDGKQSRGMRYYAAQAGATKKLTIAAEKTFSEVVQYHQERRMKAEIELPKDFSSHNNVIAAMIDFVQSEMMIFSKSVSRNPLLDRNSSFSKLQTMQTLLPQKSENQSAPAPELGLGSEAALFKMSAVATEVKSTPVTVSATKPSRITEV